MNYVIMRSCWL